MEFFSPAECGGDSTVRCRTAGVGQDRAADVGEILKLPISRNRA